MYYTFSHISRFFIVAALEEKEKKMTGDGVIGYFNLF